MRDRTQQMRYRKLWLSLLLTLGSGGIAGWATASNINAWYRHLAKPWFNPPNAVFAPVWTFLYALMGIALFRIWRKPPGPLRKRALRIFFFQLTLNLFWSFLFFYFHWIGIALIDIIVLWLGILITIFWFASLDRPAAWLLVPYIAWVSFAMLLNGAIWQLN